MPEKIQEQIEGYARKYGYKAANLKVLQTIVKKANEAGLKASIPEIETLAHDDLSGHLAVYFPDLQSLWQAFVKAQAQEAGGLTVEGKAILKKIRQNILEVFSTQQLPEKLIQEYLATMSEQDQLMVRSTGKEDSADLANPGGNESIAAVKPTPKDVSEAIGEVIASYFSEKSLEQRIKGHDDISQPPFMPVLLQRMIGEPLSGDPAQQVISGVMYTGKQGTKIQMAPGHGELIVNSKAPFDGFYVSHEGVVHSQIALKPKRLAPREKDVKGVVKRELHMVENDKSAKVQPSVTDSVTRRIANIGQIIEAEYGQPMDVEFVYQPRTDTVFIVQARPIPKGDLRNVIPSSIKPEKIKAVREKAPIVSGQVISPAGERARVITNKSEILICTTIDQALEIYLSQKDSNIKAVVVKTFAPAASHEAAEFNSKAIPVIQVEDPSAVEAMLEATQPCLIVDVQRKMIVDWHNQAEPIEDILANGLFKSSMPLQQTVQAPVYSGKPFEAESELKLEQKEPIGKLFEMIEHGTPSQAQGAFNQLAKSYYKLVSLPEKTKPITTFNEMLTELETIEATAPGNVEPARVALSRTLNRLLTLARSTSFDVDTRKQLNLLLQNAMATGLEISHMLDEIEHLDKESFPAYQHALLTLVNRIEAILVYPGNKEVFSSSLVQVLKEEQAMRRAENLAKHEQLNPEEKFYFTQFLKMSVLCINAPLKREWERFALICAKDKTKREGLAQVLNFMIRNNLGSFLVNTLFQDGVKEMKDDFEAIFQDIYVQSAKALKNINAMGLKEIKDMLDQWQRQETAWADPAQFDKLFAAFSTDFEDIMTKLDKVDLKNLGLAEKTLVFNEINRLTSILDNSIKHFKGSTQYTDKDKQAKQFAEMLTLYHRLMERQVFFVSDELIKSFKGPEDKHNTKQSILDVIRQTFEEKSKNPTGLQLSTSGQFGVNSAIITSPATFERQFVAKKQYLTLEDLFTLFHQNIIAANMLLTKDLNLERDDLPEILQFVMDSVENYKLVYGREYKESLLSARYDYPNFNLQFNLPLAQHAAAFDIQYNVVTNKMKFHLQVFGEARSRFDKIKNVTNAYLAMMGVTVTKSPTSESMSAKSMLEYEFEFNADNPDKLQDAAQLVKIMARISFADNKISIPELVKVACHYPKRAPEVGIAMRDIVKEFLFVKGQKLNGTDIRALLDLFKNMSIDKEIVADIAKKILHPQNTISSHWPSKEGMEDFISLHKILYSDSYLEQIINEKPGNYTFFETLLLHKEYVLAQQLMDNPAFKPSMHSNAVMIVANNKDYEFMQKLVDKKLYSDLMPPTVELLKKEQPALLEALETNKEEGAKSSSSESRTRNKRLPTRIKTKF